MINQRTLVIAAAGVGAAVLLYVVTRGAKNVGQDIGSGAIDLADGVVKGAVTSAGSILGIPLTDAEKAAKARKEGDVWAASEYMPAVDFIKWLAAGMPKN
ncbi:hypothetical protein [Noviherbaspirillum sp. Root189]|uniref:hypothetical protein n=1 Tax=Noviherbaspirillum sp. Root189 TaxID=1736487 RepID=UPI0007095946|nr:hypothetical protein [Noviherbaspirillum sp. Root189]KRB70499.1 hypothetical protein ASE07_07760 [Noviherbaspirillum sp. Root189]